MGCLNSKPREKEEGSILRVPPIEETSLLERKGPGVEDSSSTPKEKEGARTALPASDQDAEQTARLTPQQQQQEDEPESNPTPSLTSEALVEVDYHSWIPSDDDLKEDPTLGELFITAQYVGPNEELIVRIMRGRNILSRGPSCNPYVKVSLIPDPTKKYSFKSEVKKFTRDPSFDEHFLFPKITEHDIQRKILNITVFDESQLVKPYVGEIVIKLNQIGLDLTTPCWIPLRKAQDDEEEDDEEEEPSSSKQSKISDSDANSVAPSMMSTMSAISMKALVKNHDYGKIHLSLHHKYAKQTLQVVVIAARLNKPPGSPGLPNPYVKLYLVPDPAKKSKQKTKPQKATLDPSYNESFEFKLEKEIGDKKIQITVWDHESMGRNTFMGETLVRISSLPPNETVNKWYPLDSLSYGELNCRLTYDPATDYLTITIIRARDLVPARAGGSVDPYVKIYLLPDKKKQTKKKTHYRKQTTDPDFNETFAYFLGEIDASRQRVLQVSVLDHSSVGNSELLGAFSVPVLEIIEKQKTEQWYSLIRDKGMQEMN